MVRHTYAKKPIFASVARKLFHGTHWRGPTSKKISINYRYGLVILVPILLFLVFNSAVFKVKDVNISWDNPDLSVSAMDEVYKSVVLGKNIFLVSKQSLLKVTVDQPSVFNISLSKKYPSGLLINVKSREPFAEGIWINPEKEASISSLISRDFFGSAARQASSSGEAYLLDKDGLVFWKNFKSVTGLPKLFLIDGSKPVLGETVSGTQNKAGFMFLTDLLPRETAVGFPGLSFMVSGKDQLFAKFDGGPYVFLPQLNSYNELLDSLKLILDKYRIEGKSLKKVDLRFNNPVVEY